VVSNEDRQSMSDRGQMKHDNYLGDDETNQELLWCVQTSVTRISNQRQHNKIDMVCSFEIGDNIIRLIWCVHLKGNATNMNKQFEKHVIKLMWVPKMNTDKRQHGPMNEQNDNTTYINGCASF